MTKTPASSRVVACLPVNLEGDRDRQTSECLDCRRGDETKARRRTDGSNISCWRRVGTNNGTERMTWVRIWMAIMPRKEQKTAAATSRKKL